MKFTLTFMILFLFAACTTESESGNFNVKVRDFDGSYGYALTYFINQDSINIHCNCDFENCKDSIVYSERLGINTRKVFYSYLRSHSLDTLASKYINEGFDGLNLRISISGDNVRAKSIRLKRYYHPQIEELMHEIDKLIKVKKYKYHKN